MSWTIIDAGSGLYALDKVVDSGWCWRTVALRLPSGGSLVVSPTRGTADAAAAWLEPHPPVCALAPNHFHYLGLDEYSARFSDCRTFATEGARNRLEKRCGRSFEPLERLCAMLPEHASVLEPPGLKNGECWLRVQTDRGIAWVVTDAFFHVNNPLRGATGLVLRLTGTAPGLRIGSTFKALGIKDRRAFRRWVLEQLEHDAPRVLVPAHGDVLDDDSLAERLAALVARRL